jgi:hypothetical protein
MNSPSAVPSVFIAMNTFRLVSMLAIIYNNTVLTHFLTISIPSTTTQEKKTLAIETVLSPLDWDLPTTLHHLKNNLLEKANDVLIKFRQCHNFLT